MARILFALGHSDLESKIAMSLGDNFSVAGSVSDKRQVLPALSKLNADILVLRESLSGELGLCELIQAIIAKYPDLKIVLVMKSRPDNDPIVEFMNRLGVHGLARGGMIAPRDIRAEILQVASLPTV